MKNLASYSKSAGIIFLLFSLLSVPANILLNHNISFTWFFLQHFSVILWFVFLILLLFSTQENKKIKASAWIGMIAIALSYLLPRDYYQYHAYSGLLYKIWIIICVVTPKLLFTVSLIFLSISLPKSFAKIFTIIFAILYFLHYSFTEGVLINAFLFNIDGLREILCKISGVRDAYDYSSYEYKLRDVYMYINIPMQFIFPGVFLLLLSRCAIKLSVDEVRCSGSCPPPIPAIEGCVSSQNAASHKVANTMEFLKKRRYDVLLWVLTIIGLLLSYLIFMSGLIFFSVGGHVTLATALVSVGLIGVPIILMIAMFLKTQLNITQTLNNINNNISSVR